MASGHVNTAATSGVLLLAGIGAAELVEATAPRTRDVMNDPLFLLFASVALTAAFVLLCTGIHLVWRWRHKPAAPISIAHHAALAKALGEAESAVENNQPVNDQSAEFRAHLPPLAERLTAWTTGLAKRDKEERALHLEFVCTLAWWLRDPVYTWRPLVTPLVHHAVLQARLGLMPPPIRMALPSLPDLGQIELQSGGASIATIEPATPDDDDLVEWDTTHVEPLRLAIRRAASVALECRQVEKLVGTCRALQADRSTLLKDIRLIVQQDAFVHTAACPACGGASRRYRFRGGRS